MGFWKLIRDEMDRRGLSQTRVAREIARRTGASEGTIARYLRGDGDTASENVQVLLDYLGFEVRRKSGRGARL